MLSTQCVDHVVAQEQRLAIRGHGRDLLVIEAPESFLNKEDATGRLVQVHSLDSQPRHQPCPDEIPVRPHLWLLFVEVWDQCSSPGPPVDRRLRHSRKLRGSLSRIPSAGRPKGSSYLCLFLWRGPSGHAGTVATHRPDFRVIGSGRYDPSLRCSGWMARTFHGMSRAPSPRAAESKARTMPPLPLGVLDGITGLYFAIKDPSDSRSRLSWLWASLVASLWGHRPARLRAAAAAYPRVPGAAPVWGGGRGRRR
jgi:hypothetical protein